ncbi:MAG: flagellin [Deltaproteobacteria bacterium]|nr:flagellin [Deltaproteobacteria bacterium]
MGLRIQNNIAALNAHRHLTITDNALSKSLERLSSGYRINRAADDAAGLAVSEGLRADIKSYQVASRNTSEANSLLQVAEGALDQIGNMLTRLKELATQAASDNTSSSNRDKLNSEATQLKNEIDRIADSTNYAGTKLIDGSFNGASTLSTNDAGSIAAIANVYDMSVSDASAGTYTITASGSNLTLTSGGISQTVTITTAGTANFSTFDISFKTTSAASTTAIAAAFTAMGTMTISAGSGSTFQVGAGNTSQDRITFSIGDANTAVLGSASSSYLTDVDLTTGSDSQVAINIIDQAIDDVAGIRGDIGAVQNRLGYASANLATTIENVTAADSVIRDADMASEMTTFTKNQILLQAGTSMLAQANAAPQVILSLLK